MSDTLEELWRQARTDEAPPSFVKKESAALRRTVREVQLHAALGGVKKRKKNLPNVEYPHADELDYANAIINFAGSAMVRRLLAPLLADLPKLVRDAALQRSGVTPLVDPGKRIADAVEAARRQISRSSAAELARRYAKRVADHQRAQFAKQIKAALGVDLLSARLGSRMDSTPRRTIGAVRHDARDLSPRASYRTDAVSGRIEGFASENATLVTSFGAQSLDDIAKTLTRGLVEGTDAHQLHKDLEARFGVLDSYARRIGRDQVGKLNGRVTMDRHNEFGVTSFHWQSMEDPDVRELHQEINGNEYDYPDGHPTEGLPGEPYGCRCVAIPVLAPVQQAVDEEPAATEPEPYAPTIAIPRSPTAPTPPPYTPAIAIPRTRVAPEPKPVNQIAAPIVPKLTKLDPRKSPETPEAKVRQALHAIDQAKKEPMATVAHKNARDPDNVLEHSRAAFEANMKDLFGKPITYEEITHGFAVPDGFEAHLVKLGDNSVTWELKHVATGKSAGTLTREFRSELRDGKIKNTVEHKLFDVPAQFQNAGLSQHVNGNALRHYEKWGVDQVTVEAGWAGRYVWASSGFQFDKPADIVDSFDRYVKDNPEHFKGLDTATMRTKVEALVNEPWKLAKWQEQGTDGKDLLLPDQFNPGHRDPKTGEWVNPPPVNIGKALLLSDNVDLWFGHLPIDRTNAGYRHAIAKNAVGGKVHK